MSTSWQGDWYARLQRKVKSRGFPNVTAFALSYPGKTFEELADELDRRDVAPVQIQWLLYQEAAERDDIIGFAKDCLVRELHDRLSHGWGKDEQARFNASGAYASWITSFEARYKEPAKRAWRWLKEQNIPEGWLPAGPDDPWIEAMFRETGFPGAGEPMRPLQR